MALTTHGLALPELLHLGALLYDALPPVFLLAIRGERFGLGVELTPTAQAALKSALCWLRLNHPPGGSWQGPRSSCDK